MKLKINVCPVCGEPAISILETVFVMAMLHGPDEDGEQEYSGDSEVEWDTQEPDLLDEEATVYCDKLHEWQTEIISY